MENPAVKMETIFMDEFDSEERKLAVEILAKRSDRSYAPKRITIKFTVNWELMAQHYSQWCFDNKDRRISICDDAIIAEYIGEAPDEKPGAGPILKPA